MIPKRAIFCWTSDHPMSWLREQSIESFKMLNPDWEVDVVGAGADYPPGEGFRIDVLRSDYVRYTSLVDGGGVYFDTDIIFVRPIPEKWLDADLFAPLDNSGNISHIACLGGIPFHPFWQMMVDRCKLRVNTGIPLDCQALGTRLLHGIYLHKDMKSIPTEALLTHHWNQLEMIWADVDQKMPSWTIGVHWYGGDPLSRDMEKLFSADSMPACFLSDAIEFSLEQA